MSLNIYLIIEMTGLITLVSILGFLIMQSCTCPKGGGQTHIGDI